MTWGALSTALFIWFLAVTVTILGTLKALIHFHRKTDTDYDDHDLRPVTILKPLKGIDPDLETNLESFFRLDYPKFEILFSVADHNDPVIPVVEKLMAQYPWIPAKLYIGADNLGFNPKINNLIKSYDEARFEWVLISDSNTRFSQEHLGVLARQFRCGTALQTSVVAGVGAHGIGGNLETVFLNTFYARSMVVLDAVGHTCVMGKSMLFRKTIMDKTRGLRALSKHINEDYAAGRKFKLLGHQVQLSRQPVRQYIGTYSLAAFWARHIRWGRIRKMQAPLGFLIEPLFNSILSGVLGAAAFSYFWDVSPTLFFCCHLGLWMICDAMLASQIGDPLSWVLLPVWCLRELTHIPLWIHISMGSQVDWRGQKLHLKRAKILETRADAVEEIRLPSRKAA